MYCKLLLSPVVFYSLYSFFYFASKKQGFLKEISKKLKKFCKGYKALKVYLVRALLF